MLKKTAQFMVFAVALAGGQSRLFCDGNGPVPMFTPDQHFTSQTDGNGPVPLCTPDQHRVPQVDGGGTVPMCTPDQHCSGQP